MYPRATNTFAPATGQLQQAQKTAPDSEAEEEAAKSKKILQLHSQLNQLRQQLEQELKPTAAAASGTDAKVLARHQTDDNKPQRPSPRVIRLGSPCLSSSYCFESIKNSHCKLDTFTCACLSEHVELNSTTCLAREYLPFKLIITTRNQIIMSSNFRHGHFHAHNRMTASLLGYECLVDAQCEQKVPRSKCQGGKCVCPGDEFVPYRKNKCLTGKCI